MNMAEIPISDASGCPLGVPLEEAILAHVGVKRRSGRYPWGSGENPYQSEKSPPHQAERKRQKTIIDSKRKVTSDPVKIERQEMIKAKNLRNMSQKDLQDMIDRMKKEKELKNLVEADIAPGRKVIKEVLADVGKQTAKEVLQGSVRYGINLALQDEDNRKFNAADLAKAIYPNLNKKDKKDGG